MREEDDATIGTGGHIRSVRRQNASGCAGHSLHPTKADGRVGGDVAGQMDLLCDDDIPKAADAGGCRYEAALMDSVFPDGTTFRAGNPLLCRTAQDGRCAHTCVIGNLTVALCKALSQMRSRPKLFMPPGEAI